jgi:hypothetical protein
MQAKLRKQIISRRHAGTRVSFDAIRRKEINTGLSRLVDVIVLCVFVASVSLLIFTILSNVKDSLLITVLRGKESKLSKQYEAIKNSNDSIQNNLETNLNLDEIFNIAVLEYGMKYPSKNDVIYFDKNNGEYVKFNEGLKR